MNNKEPESEHVITDRERRAWQANKKRKPAHERPELSLAQRIEFLELLAQMSSRAVFERKLGLTATDIESYKKELDVESQDEARRAARVLKNRTDDQHEAYILEQTKKAREAEAVANDRLESMMSQKAKDMLTKERTVDVNSAKADDAERQRRFAAQQAELEKPEKEWRLPIESNSGSQEEQIDRFRREIVYHGFRFVQKKYRGVTPAQIKWEAARLGLVINWDIVR